MQSIPKGAFETQGKPELDLDGDDKPSGPQNSGAPEGAPCHLRCRFSYRGLTNQCQVIVILYPSPSRSASGRLPVKAAITSQFDWKWGVGAQVRKEVIPPRAMGRSS
jgi:hypothetical protein